MTWLVLHGSDSKRSTDLLHILTFATQIFFSEVVPCEVNLLVCGLHRDKTSDRQIETASLISVHVQDYCVFTLFVKIGFLPKAVTDSRICAELFVATGESYKITNITKWGYLSWAPTITGSNATAWTSLQALETVWNLPYAAFISHLTELVIIMAGIAITLKFSLCPPNPSTSLATRITLRYSNGWQRTSTRISLSLIETSALAWRNL